MATVRFVVGRLRLAASTLLQKQPTFPLRRPLSSSEGSLVYRGSAVKETRTIHYMGEALSTFMWYWILYHCWYEYDHLVPQDEFPDPNKFTDEELGIPPDDED